MPELTLQRAVPPAPKLAPAGLPGISRPSVNILSVASEIPTTVMTSAELAPRLGTDENWIVSRTGIRERPWVGPEERLSDYAARAGAKALSAAGVSAEQLDLVIVATITADQVTPAAATQVARQLGAVRAGAFDVSAACTGFLTGLAVGAGQIESGRARHVLLIGADFCSRITDKHDRRSAPLFADAAGAVVIAAGVPGAGPWAGVPVDAVLGVELEPRPASRTDPASSGLADTQAGATSAQSAGAPRRTGGPDGWVGPILLASDGDPERALYADHGERKLRMDGTAVFKQAVARMQEASVAALSATGLTLADIDLVVCHQANARITRALRERLGLEEERVVDCIERLGNSSAATLPVALAHAQQDGRLRPGTRVLLTAFGAGFTWGACVLNWGASPSSAVTILSGRSQPSGPSAPGSDRD